MSLKEQPSQVAQTEFGTIRWYSVVRVDAITLAANTPFTFKSADAGPDNLGAIVTRGTLIPAAGNPHAELTPANGWMRPFDWPEPGEADFTTGPDGVDWLCLSNTRGNQLTVDYHAIDGAFMVPFDWGYVIASGTVTDGGEQGAAGDYFAPSNQDREITGTADLLLVR